MTAPDKNDVGDPEAAMQQYESLRANALGELNHATGLTQFLRDGMSAWLRALRGYEIVRRTTRREPSFVTRTDSNMPGAVLANILTDAILNTAGMVGYSGGHR